MGSEARLDATPRFRVRAVGSFKQKPGCPDVRRRTRSARSASQQLCRGECYNPSDERQRITRIEVVRIRPQSRPGEPVAQLIEDPWRRFDVPGRRATAAPSSSTIRTSSTADRETIYYVRAIQEPTPAVNAGGLRCDYDDERQLRRGAPVLRRLPHARRRRLPDARTRSARGRRRSTSGGDAMIRLDRSSALLAVGSTLGLLARRGIAPRIGTLPRPRAAARHGRARQRRPDPRRGLPPRARRGRRRSTRRPGRGHAPSRARPPDRRGAARAARPRARPRARAIARVRRELAAAVVTDAVTERHGGEPTADDLRGASTRRSAASSRAAAGSTCVRSSSPPTTPDAGARAPAMPPHGSAPASDPASVRQRARRPGAGARPGHDAAAREAERVRRRRRRRAPPSRSRPAR